MPTPNEKKRKAARAKNHETDDREAAGQRTVDARHLFDGALVLVAHADNVGADGADHGRQRTDDAEDAGSGDSADADDPDVGSKDLVDRHLGDGHGAGREDAGGVGADGVDQWDEHEIREEGPGADDGCIADADDVADADDGGVVEDAKGHELALEDLAEPDRAETQELRPGVEGRGEAVVQRADAGGHREDLALAAGAFAREQDFGGCGAFGPRKLAVHLDHEVVAQRDQEEDAETATEKRDHDDLENGRLDDPRQRVGRQHVERRDGEDRSRDDVGRVGADGLDDDVFQDRAAAGEERRQCDREDGDWNRGFDALADPECQIGGGHRKEAAEDQPHRHRTGRDLGDAGLVGHHGDIDLAGFQRSARVLRQSGNLRRLAVLHGVTSLVEFRTPQCTWA